MPAAGDLIHEVLLFLHHPLSIGNRLFFLQFVQDLAVFNRIDELGLFLIHFFLCGRNDFLLSLKIVGQQVQKSLKGNKIGNGGAMRQLVLELSVHFRAVQLELIKIAAGLQ